MASIRQPVMAWSARACALLVALFAACAAAAPPIFTATRIGALGGNASFGVGINHHGEAVGWSWTSGMTAPHAWRATGAQTTDLGTFGGIGAFAYAINDRGDIVGQVNVAGSSFEAFVLAGSPPRSLHPAGAAGSAAFNVSPSGLIVGDYLAGGVLRAALYNGASVTDLGSLGGTSSQAYGINASGQIVGFSNDAGGNQRAFLHSSGVLTNLGTLGGTFSAARAINVHGAVVGYSSTSGPNVVRAFLYTDGQMRNLGTLGGSTSSAEAINDAGQIVGQALTGLGASNGFLYSDGTMYDLNTLVVSGLGGARLTYGVAINNKTQIVAQACPTTVTCQTFRLDPTAPAGKVRAIEYHHAAFGHYFLTTIDDEITKLDNGTFVGWSRTGEGIHVDAGAPGGTVPVCRFFSATFTPKSSHFYTPFASECETVKQNPVWTFEGEVFSVALPDGTGACPAGRVAVYRLYNNGLSGAPNHRYTTSLNIRAAMIALGWVPEGLGPQGVIMCV